MGERPPRYRSSPSSARTAGEPSSTASTWARNRPQKVADDLLARFALTGAGDRRVPTYSGGMRRRLDIAMGSIGDPPVVFLDEPTTGLAPERRREVWRTVGVLADHGTTVLLTTQYLEEAEALADRIAILHRDGSSSTARWTS